jgi:predicted O-methyltransferase YrrM
MEVNIKHILDYQGADFKSFDMKQSIEFASAIGNYPKEDRGMGPPELEMIYKGLQLLGAMPLTIVETGMGWGYSTRMFMLHVIKYGGEVHTIDLTPRELFLENLEKLGIRDYVNIHAADARQFNNWDKPIDFLNLDSEHAISNVLGEYFRFRLFLKHHRALIGFHDICLPAVSRGIEILNEVDNLEPVFIDVKTGGFGYNIYRMQYLEKKEFPDYNSSALTEAQKQMLILEL